MSEGQLTQILCPFSTTPNHVPHKRLGDRPMFGKCRTSLTRGHPIDATDANFRRFVDKSDLPVMVNFWATWCGPCNG